MTPPSLEPGLLRGACDGLPFGLMLLRPICSASGDIVDFEWSFANSAATRVLEECHEELCGRRLLEQLPPDCGGTWFHCCLAVAETGDSREVQLCGVRARCTKLDDAVAVLFLDPDPRAEVEAADDRRSDRLPIDARTAELLLQAPFAISIVRGPEHRFVLANDCYETMVGRQGLLGKSMREAFPELRPGAPVLEMLDGVRATGQPFSAEEFRVPLDLDDDGVLEDHYFRFTCSPLRENGDVVALQTVAFDVTTLVESRLRAEDAAQRIAESERRFRATFETAAVGIAHVSTNGRWLRFNDRLLEILGRSREELSQLTFQDVTHPDDLAKDVALADELLRGEIANYQLDKRYVRNDGRAVWANLTGSLVRDDAGEPLFFVAIVKDIAERKSAEEALHEADRHKDEFLAMLGHELRNPLAAIRSASELLETIVASENHNPALPRIQQVIERQTSHMARLLDDLLDLARITSGKLVLAPTMLDLCEVVLDVVSDLGASMRELRFTIDVPPSPLWVRGDRIRLAQVVHNLLSNAVKYTPPQGTLSVRLAVDRGGALLTVVDSGIGLDPELQRRLFKPFQQAPQDIARSSGGLGLGLAISKSIVELHQGTIEARSEGCDRGSEFEVWLPLAEPITPLLDAPTPEGTERMSILLVEDNEDVAELFAALLRARGHEVRIAERGGEALEILESWRPSVVICDIGLPDIDGYAVARAIRANPALAGLDLVALSGYGQDEDRRRSAEAGFDMHFTKPTDVDEILRAIREPGVRPPSRSSPRGG